MTLADFMTWGDLFKTLGLFLGVALFFMLIFGFVFLLDRFTK